MADGVHGKTIAPAVNLVAEVLNTDTDLATLHLHRMEETRVLVQCPNLLAATRTVVQVRKHEKRYKISI